MAVAGGALEAIDMQAEDLPLLPELLRNSVGIFPRSFSLADGGALAIDAVFVGAGGENRAVSLHVFQRANGVGGNGRIRVADVRSGVGVIDRRGQVIIFHLDGILLYWQGPHAHAWRFSMDT